MFLVISLKLYENDLMQDGDVVSTYADVRGLLGISLIQNWLMKFLSL